VPGPDHASGKSGTDPRWLTFAVDLRRMIRQRQSEAARPVEEELYRLIVRDNYINVPLLMPGLALLNLAAIVGIYFSPRTGRTCVGIRPSKLTPKEVKNLGAAEPRYVLRSPGTCRKLCETLRTFVGI
jgi:hypothetical protein